jgi:hypothetical protein
MPTALLKQTWPSVPQDAPHSLRESVIRTRYHEESTGGAIITRYLLENVEEFRQLSDLREQVNALRSKLSAGFKQQH